MGIDKIENVVYNKSVLYDTLFESDVVCIKMFLFNNVDEDIIKNVNCTEKRYSGGEIIYDYDNYSRALGYVADGTVIIEQNGVALKLMREGDVFGAASLFNEAEDYVSVIKAKTACKIIFFKQETISKLITENSVIALNYITFLSERIRYLNTKIAAFTAGSAEERLAKYIMDIYNDTYNVELKGLSYSNLASSLDIGRASLYRVINSFIKQGLIEKNGRRIIIKDIDKINRIIKNDKE